MTVHLISLGCTKNLVDSEVMLGALGHCDIVDDISVADIVIVNTCGFIGSAKQESINTILQAHSDRKPNSTLVVAGCLTQRYRDELTEQLPEVDIWTGVGDYDKIDEVIKAKVDKFTDKVFLNDDKTPRVVTGSTYHAYIKLGEGCNQSCSFCAIPSFKGKLQSKSLDTIRAEVQNLLSQGYFDFTFVSQDSSSYLFDYGIRDGLVRLIETIENIKEIKYAKILYLYPSTTTAALIDKIGRSKIFFSYFDMPLQHISKKLLQTMKRGKGAKQIKRLLNQMRRYDDSFVRSTFIVGHPSESDKQFKKLHKFIKRFNFDRVNVFAYSDEEGTTAHKMTDKIPPNIINHRAKKLGKTIAKQTQKHLAKLIGQTINIVIDGKSSQHEYLLTARPISWAPDIDGEILINDSELDTDIKIGQIYKALITDIAGEHLVATVLDASDE